MSNSAATTNAAQPPAPAAVVPAPSSSESSSMMSWMYDSNGWHGLSLYGIAFLLLLLVIVVSWVFGLSALHQWVSSKLPHVPGVSEAYVQVPAAV